MIKATFIKEGEKAGHKAAALGAYYDYEGEQATLQGFEENYIGEFENEKDFLTDRLENDGTLTSDSFLYSYIDWEALARDMMQDYFSEGDFYFYA